MEIAVDRVTLHDLRIREVTATALERREYRCANCGYGVVVRAEPPQCPMCHEQVWLPYRTLAW